MRAVVDKCDEMNCSVDPTSILCDFESAAINAVHAVLGAHVTVRGCFFHLCQSTWRKIQELGLISSYKDDEQVSNASIFIALNLERKVAIQY